MSRLMGGVVADRLTKFVKTDTKQTNPPKYGCNG
jgi:hypothetical protein